MGARTPDLSFHLDEKQGRKSLTKNMSISSTIDMGTIIMDTGVSGETKKEKEEVEFH
jgi:hypothetical protein